MVSLWVCAMLALCAQSYKLVYNYDYTNVSTLCFVPSVETPVAIQEQFSALRSLPALFTSKYYLTNSLQWYNSFTFETARIPQSSPCKL